MDEKTAKTGIRLEPDLALRFKIAYTTRRESAQNILHSCIVHYVEETERLEKEGLLLRK